MTVAGGEVRPVIDETIYDIFRRGSKTYFYSTLFFPPRVRKDVFSLYSFVRVADDYVDAVPQEVDEFYAFTGRYAAAAAGEATGDVVIDSFVELAGRKDFDPAWTVAFLSSMESDITVTSYRTIRDLEGYLYGSSEVVGLMMARLLDLPPESYVAAQNLGRAMQYVNFIRDIAEDLALGRTYFPAEEIEAFGLDDLSAATAARHPRGFAAFLRFQLRRYREWQEQAETGFRYIPRRYRIPIRTASDMYRWTAQTIEHDPAVVYRGKVKPSVGRIVSRAAANTLKA
ncbi:phytoene/squalene synthase family protein [Methanoculleus sp.]|uniref:phytoene/squalene synthase family protein n=1 Tax=Methanoculleus sp. TaxID=90427 RepID=UPI00262B2C0A|nr:phytoene/squalene synthase family protein [Methanoculleus sp.]MDD3215370.1 phytoene/squalene synthase family protein [Methanoculleus sp.]HOI58408.1 phytoene/squalene synthase family protein [Methanoculleus sp.]